MALLFANPWNLIGWFSLKIIKIVATRCQILRLKCTKFDFAYSAPPDPLAGFEGTYF